MDRHAQNTVTNTFLYCKKHKSFKNTETTEKQNLKTKFTGKWSRSTSRITSHVDSMYSNPSPIMKKNKTLNINWGIYYKVPDQ